MSSTHGLLDLLPRFGLDEHEIALRKIFLEWNGHDSERINAAADKLTHFHSVFVGELYDHLQTFPELQAILSSETTLERLKSAQVLYYRGLVNGPYDMHYVAERLHVGIVHERIGLDMKWYLGAYRLYVERLCQELMGEHPAASTFISILKAVFLDISLATDAYFGTKRQALEASEARFARAMRGANDGLWDWNLSTDCFYVSPRWASMLGITQVDVQTAQNWQQRVHVDDLDHLRAAIDAHIQGATDHLNCEYRIQSTSGSYLWVQMRGVAELDADNHWRLTGSQTDIHERKMLEQSLEYAANHDPLTKLGNRSQLDRILEERHDSRYKKAHILFIDLDQFKLINDSLGHAVGDEVLIETSRRLRASLQEYDQLVRFGGDEFIVITVHDPKVTAQTILNNLRMVMDIAEHSFSISASLGIAPLNGSTPDYDPLQAADLAMYQAKKSGKDQYASFSGDMQYHAHNQMMLEIELGAALDRNEFEVYYQPIYDIRGYKPVMRSVEALLRWNSPNHKVGPQEFIPLLEQTNNIVRVGEWVLSTTVHQVKTWHDQGHYINCSVNVSLRQLQQPDFAAVVLGVLQEARFPTDKLILELTEGQLMHGDPILLQNLRLLAARGIRIALDDFGTGYCSFSYLKRFPLHILKVDKSFVQFSSDDKTDQDIGRAIIGLGNTLKLQVIAEGVETEDHLEFLRSESCAFAQGYLFSKPKTAVQMEEAWASAAPMISLASSVGEC